jgi:hypothetical protein
VGADLGRRRSGYLDANQGEKMMGQLAETYAAMLGEGELRQRIRAYRHIGMDKMARLYESQLATVLRKKG